MSNSARACRIFSLICAFSGLATSLISCRTQATQIQLFIDTDAPLDRAMTLEVFSFVGSVAGEDLARRAAVMPSGTLHFARDDAGLGTFTAGGSIGVLPPMEVQAGRPLAATVWLRARIAATASSPEIRVDRVAGVSFIRGRSGTARVYLPLRCGDRSVGCSSVSANECSVSVRCREQNTTCGDLGECVASQVPVVFRDPDGGVEDTGPLAGVDANTGRVDVVAPSPLDTGVFPRPIAPVSLGNVSLRRPTLRWELPAGMDGALVDMCRDRACTSVIETLRASGTTTRTTMPLPVHSVVFWRLRGTVGAATSVTFSPTWLFHVPATDNSRAIDTSYNAHLDLNGDGFDDLCVGAHLADVRVRPDSGTVSVFYGGMTGVSMTPTAVLEGAAAGDQFGISVASAGDVNGDGFGDLVVGALEADPRGLVQAGTASLFHGGPMGVAMVAARVLEGVAATDRFGWSVAGAGDVNLDGYGDVVIGALSSPGGRMGAGTATVFHGTPSGIGSAPANRFEGAAAFDTLGVSVASAGDVNGDGFGDLVVGAYLVGQNGTANIYHGSATGLASAPSSVLAGTMTRKLFGCSVASAGDVNGDGFGDLIVGADNERGVGVVLPGTASIFHGDMTGVALAPARVLEGLAVSDTFGESVASAGDLNADGFADVIVAAPSASPGGRMSAGRVSVFHGSAMGIPMASAQTLDGLSVGDRFGLPVAGIGDVNGDGFADLAIGAFAADIMGRNNTGTVFVFHGSLAGIRTVANRVLEGVAPIDQFGVSVARVWNISVGQHWRLWSSVTQSPARFRRRTL